MMPADDPLKVLGDLLKSAQQPIAPVSLAQANAVQMNKFQPPGDWQTFAHQTGRITCPTCHALNSAEASICQTCKAPLTPA